MARFDLAPVGLERRLPAFHANFGRVLIGHALFWLVLCALMLGLLLEAAAAAGDVPGCTVTDTNPCSAPPTRAAGLRAPRADGFAVSASHRPSAGIVALVKHESGYRPHVRGRAGEWGLGQIKCQTARGLGFAGACSALRDPATNLRWSMAYLKLALARYDSWPQPVRAAIEAECVKFLERNPAAQPVAMTAGVVKGSCVFALHWRPRR